MSLLNRIKSAIKYRGMTFPKPLEDPSELEWPERWNAIHYDDIGKFSRELIREMPARHRLQGLPLCVMGRKEDRDDFLFQIEDPEYRFACVHLTWSKESDPQWPCTTLYRTFDDFVAEEQSESEQNADGTPPPPESPSQPTQAKGDPPLPVRLAVGPSPWAWRDRSHIMGGCRFRFRDLGEDGKLSGVTTVLNERDEIILLLDFHIYARFLDDGRALLWWEEGEKVFKEIAFASVIFESLKAIEQPVEAAKHMRDKKAKTVGLDGIKIVRFQCFLEAGSHEIDAPDDLKDFEETLVLADHAAGSNGYDVMHRALFVFDWINRQVIVMPQDWFNNGKYDFGYQWVARIARTESGSLIGEGIRLGTFELDESGREVKEWLSQNPFHMIK